MLAIIQGKGKGICFLRLPTRGGEVTLLPPGRFQALAPGEIEGRGQNSQQTPSIPRPRMERSGGRWSSQSSPPPVGTQGLTACSPFLLTLPYFTADCSCGNWNEDELQAAGKVPGHPGRAAARSAATLPEHPVTGHSGEKVDRTWIPSTQRGPRNVRSSSTVKKKKKKN